MKIRYHILSHSAVITFSLVSDSTSTCRTQWSWSPKWL